MMDDFELKVQAQMHFNKTFGAMKAAEFSVHLQETIDGLTKNNMSFVETYHKQVTEIRSLREALAFYADITNHCLRMMNREEFEKQGSFIGGSKVSRDMGKRARVALGLEPAPETEE